MSIIKCLFGCRCYTKQVDVWLSKFHCWWGQRAETTCIFVAVQAFWTLLKIIIHPFMTGFIFHQAIEIKVISKSKETLRQISPNPCGSTRLASPDAGRSRSPSDANFRHCINRGQSFVRASLPFRSRTWKQKVHNRRCLGFFSLTSERVSERYYFTGF